MPAIARAQLQGGGCGCRRMRPQTRLADGLRRHYGGVQADLGEARSPLSQRNSRAKKSDERRNRGVDLEKVEAEIAVAYGSRCGRNLHSAMRLSGRINHVRAGERVLQNGFEIIRHQICEARRAVAFVQFVSAGGKANYQLVHLGLLRIESLFCFLKSFLGHFDQQWPINSVLQAGKSSTRPRAFLLHDFIPRLSLCIERF